MSHIGLSVFVFASPFPFVDNPSLMISVAEAIQIVREHTPALPAERISLDDALGRVLAEDIVADSDLPPFGGQIIGKQMTVQRRKQPQISQIHADRN